MPHRHPSQEPDFQRLFESSPGLYLVLTPDLRIVAASDAYLRATRTSRNAIIGRGLFEVFPDNPDDPAATGVSNLRASLDRVLRTRAADTMAVQKYDIRRPESEGGGFEERFWSPVNSPVLGPGGEVTHIIHRVEDVTEFVRLKQAGAESERRAGAMEQEIYLRAQEVQETNRRLREANAELERKEGELRALDEMKTQFFANVSHELRTPLALILGPGEALLDSGAVAPERRHDLETMLRNARLLLRHVNDLLDIAKLDAGKLALSPARVDVAALVRQIASNFESYAERRGDAFVVDAPGPLEGEVDAEKLDRIVMNLLANAFKFTPPGGRVRVTLRADGPAARIEVADSGPGIPEAQRETVFERFVQADLGAARHFGGTGLGLSIVREFVHLHRGTVTAGPAPEGGALFTVRLPLRAAAAPAPALRAPASRPVAPDPAPPHPAPAAPASPDAPHVLVVEDNPDMRAFVVASLTPAFRASTAFDGLEGLRLVEALRPDLVLTDVMMPGMGGPDLARALRARPEFDAIPLMFLTAREDDALRVQMLRDGAQDFLTKPFRAEELRARVANLVARKKAREKLEAEFRQAQKMEAVGRLAGSVAHDFNNLLTVILGNATLVQEAASRSGPVASFASEIESAASRAAALTRRLLGFSRRQPVEPRVTTLNAVVTGMESLVRRLAGEDVSVRTVLEPSPWPVFADPAQLEQALMNLVVNARDAMPGGGTVTLETANAPAGGDRPVPLAGDCATVAVSDTGTGMAPEALARLFEPFFTTKEPGKGTGLGLSTVKGIVAGVGGHVQVASTPGRGTTIRLWLPRTAGALPAAASAPPPAAPAGGRESVLLVEDDPALLRLAADTLRARGYTVHAAPTAEAALAFASAHPSPLDLLVTDIVLPGLNGLDLAARLAASRPALKVLLLSGYSDDAVSLRGTPAAGAAFLQKPYRLAELLRKVREVLEGAGRG